MIKSWRLLLVLVAATMILSACAELQVTTVNELGPNTLSRIDRVNSTLRGGLEIGPETRATIKELNQTIRSGIKAGFDPSTLQRIDHLLRKVEDGFKFGIDDETLARIDSLIGAIDNAPDKWQSTAAEIARSLEDSAGSAAKQMADGVTGVITEARVDTEKLMAVGGVELRCNVDFLGARVGASLDEFMGRSLVARLRAIIKGEQYKPETPIPWVCQVLPDEIQLAKVGSRLLFRDGLVRVVGYNFVDLNLPQLVVVTRGGESVELTQMPHAYRVSSYMIQINLQGTDFSGATDGSRIEFRWPNVPDRNGIGISLPEPPTPEADFNVNRRDGSAPLEVSFTDSSSENPTAWKWEFGDGETSRLQNPVYTYQRPGSYTVRLTATNPQGSDTEVKIDYIIVGTPVPPPIAIPDITGRGLLDARRLLEVAGFVVGETVDESGNPVRDQDVDSVLRSQPPPGQIAQRGSSVRLVVSKVQRIMVPNLIGWRLEDAKQALKDVGLEEGPVTLVTDPETAKGLIAGTDPAEGALLPRHGAVSLRVSRGKTCVVRNVTLPTEQQNPAPLHPIRSAGDDEYNGHGPKVNVSVRVFLKDNEVKARITMSAEETDYWVPMGYSVRLRAGDTKAKGEWITSLYQADPAKQIIRRLVLRRPFVDWSFTAEKTQTTRTGQVDEPISKIVVIGDTEGPDIGTHDGKTGVAVEFRDIDALVLEDPDACDAHWISVQFDQIDVLSPIIDNINGQQQPRIQLELGAGDALAPWSSTATEVELPAEGYPISLALNRRVEVMVAARESLSVHGLNVGEYVAQFLRTYSSAENWGRGSHRDCAGDEYCLSYTITIDGQ